MGYLPARGRLWAYTTSGIFAQVYTYIHVCSSTRHIHHTMSCTMYVVYTLYHDKLLIGQREDLFLIH